MLPQERCVGVTFNILESISWLFARKVADIAMIKMYRKKFATLENSWRLSLSWTWDGKNEPDVPHNVLRQWPIERTIAKKRARWKNRMPKRMNDPDVPHNVLHRWPIETTIAKKRALWKQDTKENVSWEPVG
jgi:hypothetical protein